MRRKPHFFLFQFRIETITALASSSAPSRTTCTVFVTLSSPPCAPSYPELELEVPLSKNHTAFAASGRRRNPYAGVELVDTGLFYLKNGLVSSPPAEKIEGVGGKH